ncbi:DNA mismatch repair protein [Leptospira ryugenii]|uniref:DNA mismatch repair protein MutL n=1 Tax=Leptospira ryugenii TaxID=1917863 RepID=A0A2P2DYG4_9LEPT|nr:DNA mismatch repair endonuclease MutL [Leptospira ryugenii]GBF49646.1 DNA mismatch repair protein [Leptospira ryugenii]
MGKIHSLSPELVNQIAAGEVIESTHSILKELIENSLDAGATALEIATENAGLSRILVSDNGQGIQREDLPLAIQRYATSKIQNFRDLESLSSFGFRGEALASIASVSRVLLASGTEGQRVAYQITVEEGKVIREEEIPHFQGTRIEITDLFYNTPVRRKFLKSEMGEEKKNRIRVQTMALAEPGVSFRYIQNEREVVSVPRESAWERVLSLFGENLRDHLLEVQLERNGIKIQGWISHPDFYKSQRSGQFFFVNQRAVDLKFSSQILKRCYGELLPSGAFPYAFLFLSLPANFVDVNVHPQKREVRFLSEEVISGLLYQAVIEVLRNKTPIEFLEMRRRLSLPQVAQLPREQTSDGEPDLLMEMPLTKRTPYEVETHGPGINLHLLTDSSQKQTSFVPKKHFGIVFETFILAEGEDGLYIIDQHTAHERIRYEEVLRDLKQKAYKRQALLSPIRLEMTKEDAQAVFQEKEKLSGLGIEIDAFSGGTILVREVPSYLNPGEEKDTILEFLETRESTWENEQELYDEMAKCIACRSAVKKGDQISDALIAELLQRLSYCENPSLCPHGRPTLIKLTKTDLLKMFHRI